MAKRGERKLYFAYGSNMDQVQMWQRCPSAVPVCTATLQDYALAFAGHSPTWGGAVATVVRRAGAVVRGALYRLSAEDFALLDRFEGAPHVYRRMGVEVLDEDGCLREVQYYVIGRQHFAAPPSQRYVDALAHSYQAMGHDLRPLASALSGVRLFVYGTLMRGESNHALLESSFGVGRDMKRPARYLGEAETQPGYTMHDFGSFPAVVEGGGQVRGEVYDVGWAHLQSLDALERHPDWYRRALVDLAGGDEVEAYLMPAKAARGKPRVCHGHWHGKRGAL